MSEQGIWRPREAATMDAKASAAWNAWLKQQLDAALAEFSKSVGKALAEQRRAQRAELEALRLDIKAALDEIRGVRHGRSE